MGAINDFFAVMKDFQSVGKDSIDDAIYRKRSSSISARAMEGTLQFPTIVSRSLDIDTLQMITKALERQFASFTQVALTMSPFLDMEKDKNPAGYIRKFHQNMKKGNLRDEFFDILESTKESYDVHTSQDFVAFVAVGEGFTGGTIIDNREGLIDIMEGLATGSINDLYVPGKALGPSVVTEAQHAPKPQPTTVVMGGETKVQDGSTRFDNAQVTQNITNNIRGGSSVRPPGTTGSGYDQKLPTRVLQDNDVKKSNELVPSTMHMRVTMINGEQENQGNLDFIVGIKATMHPVTSTEMVDNIYNGIKKSGSFFKFVRWTTGEISFARDYLMNLTEIKEDAARTSHKESRWWTALKRRRKLAKLRNAIFLPGNLLPNASIVLSIEEAEYIKREFGFDILDPRIAYKVMNEYFLISVTVVDPGAQIAHFLFDGVEDYQTVTFTGLERGDVSGGGVNFKDVLKLVQRT